MKMRLARSIDAPLQRFDVEQQRQRPHLQGDAGQDRQDGDKMVGPPRDRVGGPVGDEAQRKRQQDADGGDGAVAENRLDQVFPGILLVQATLPQSAIGID